ncbi:hypothetical protein C5167_022291 [Papaver somniferum]|uniref:Uncharacterized protein n=1 Tax=Papaver somniferum TaxID=3469 RepID=A0A4Y7JL70_PAPSO|nr:hypothetical protein C5167_022291 [Papaver somniferum]
MSYVHGHSHEQDPYPPPGYGSGYPPPGYPQGPPPPGYGYPPPPPNPGHHQGYPPNPGYQGYFNNDGYPPPPQQPQYQGYQYHHHHQSDDGCSSFFRGWFLLFSGSEGLRFSFNGYLGRGRNKYFHVIVKGFTVLVEVQETSVNLNDFGCTLLLLCVGGVLLLFLGWWSGYTVGA